jgi:hypothetical protein
VRSCSPRLGRFDSCAAPLRENGMVERVQELGMAEHHRLFSSLASASVRQLRASCLVGRRLADTKLTQLAELAERRSSPQDDDAGLSSGAAAMG